jgi:drug/metabolite transporter (DMT)-like permease
MIRISDENLGLILAVLAAVGFAAKTVLAKLCFNYGADPVVVLALRMSFAGPIFAGILFFNLARKRWTLKLTRGQWLWVAALALLGYYLSPLLDFSGLKYVDATLGRMILFIYPTLVVLINLVLTRRRLDPSLCLALAFSYGGLGLMMVPRLSGSPAGFGFGCALIFGAAVTFAFYLVAMEKIFKTVNVSLFTTIVLSLSCLAVLIHFSLTRPLAESLSATPAPVVFYGAAMGLVSTVMPVYAMNFGIARLGASRAALVGLLGPVITFILCFFILDERLTLIQFAGMILVIFGISRMKS